MRIFIKNYFRKKERLNPAFAGMTERITFSRNVYGR